MNGRCGNLSLESSAVNKISRRIGAKYSGKKDRYRNSYVPKTTPIPSPDARQEVRDDDNDASQWIDPMNPQ
jgi:hypothetical protein